MGVAGRDDPGFPQSLPQADYQDRIMEPQKTVLGKQAKEPIDG